MSGENLASISSALSTFFQEPLHQEWNRNTLLLNRLSAVGDIGDGKGKSVNFDVEFSGATASTVAEGSDVADSEFSSDVDIPGVLPWAHYRTSFKISETEFAAAMSSGGTPEQLRRLFENRVMANGAKLMRAIEQDFLTGTGVDSLGNPTIVGIYGGALVGSGLYAGISTSAYPEWAANILGNGGVARALSPDLLAQADAEIFTAASTPWDLLITSAGVARKYEGLFTTGSSFPLIRMNDNAKSPFYGLGVPVGPTGQMTGLAYKGQEVMRLPTNPASKLALLNTKKIQIKYLPHPTNLNDAVYSQVVEGEGSNGMGSIQVTGIPIRIAMLAKTGESYKVMMTVTIQAAVTRPNAMALVTDISES